MSQAEKLEKILRYFQRSGTCHTLKDLENALPSAASIHKMQVKDLIKELTDENQVKVEKIGSGTWYWCWAGEEARDKRNMVAQLQYVLSDKTDYMPADIVLFRVDKSKIDESSAALSDRVERLLETQRDAESNTTHQEYLKQLGPLEDEVRKLAGEKDSWENAVAGGVEGLRADIAKLREETSLLVDNIDTIESQLQTIFNGETLPMDQIRRSCYGALYIEGEGLPEIEDQ